MMKIIKVTAISAMLLVTQLLVFSQMGAYATPPASEFSDEQQGTIHAQDKMIVAHLPAPKVGGPPISIPLRMGDENQIANGKTGGPSGGGGSTQTIATVGSTTTAVKQLTFNGLGYDNVTPPDVQIASGTSNVMEMVNLQGQIWDKSGVPQGGPFSLSSFFSTSSSDSISDPQVIFDSDSGKWFATITDITTSSIKVAVSQTSDATGGFCVYNIAGSSSLILDQPVIGVSHDKFIVSTNNFSKFSGIFKGAQFWILNKDQMGTTPCSPVSFASKTTTSYFSIHPAQSETSSPTAYMASISSGSSPKANVFTVNGIPGISTVTVSVNNLPISSVSSPPSAIQKGTTYKLDSGDYRTQTVSWANNALWLGHSNKCTPTGDSTSRACAHLVKIDTNTMSVKQDFNYGVSGKYVLYPALRILPNNNLFVVTGLSSSNDYPSIQVNMQATTDSINTLQSSIVFKQGSNPVTLSYGCSNNVCRYGDYFGASVDPSVANGIWVAGEFGSGVTDSYGYQWATQLADFTG